MDNSTRRSFLKDLGLGTAALSIPAEQENAKTMPGRPTTGEMEDSASGTIMAIAAHPGDAFFAMGAPVAQHIQDGGRGVFVSLSLGEKGSATIPPARYGPMQKTAAENAARMLSAQTEFLTYGDGEIPFNDEISFAVCDLIRKHQPAVVLTHWRGSWHKDHQNCYKIVNDAIFYAALPGIVRKLPAHRTSRLFFPENWEDMDGFHPDTYSNVSAAFARWLKACAAFPMWRGETGFRYDDYYRSLGVARGCLSGFKYAVALMSPPEQLTRRLRSL
ncbi:MAG TPA: PIG-L family deacetylase [Terriglobia bacterium]|nr:PIG-L family deacetylase [Terriglobia bacterium]